jgi:ABC-type lipoprotein export system ATPase subunit
MVNIMGITSSTKASIANKPYISDPILNAPSLLEGSNLRKSFGRTPALVGVTLQVAPAEVVAIVGPSGSGKSTLLHCLSRLEHLDSGEVTALGQRITDLREPKLTQFRRQYFGFVFQFPSLIPELSALENVALVGWMAGMNKRVARDAARTLLGCLGMQEREAHLPGQLSGGEAQRVVLARALINSPRIIFADEPTGALDSHNAATVSNLLVSMAKEQGCAVVLVTHDPVVAKLADRQLLMRDGVIVHS